MILPLFGFLGPLKKHYETHGLSNKSGFKLRFISDQQITNFATSNYVEKSDVSSATPRILLYVRIVASLIMTALFLFAYFYYYNFVVIGLAFLIGLIWTAALLAFFTLLFDKETREWHACEHKSSVLLDAGLEPTKLNLERCPKLLIYCGSGWLILAMIFVTTLYILIAEAVGVLIIPKPYLEINNFILLSSLLVLMAMTTGLHHNKWAAALMMLIGWPPILIVVIFASLAVKNPAPDKIRRTAVDLKNWMENQ